MALLKLIKWPNLLLIAAVQIAIKYALLEPFGVATTLSHFEFGILVLSSLCLAAAGSIIYDIYNVDADTVNCPEQNVINKSISEKKAYNFFFAFNIIAIGLGFYLANTIGRSNFFALFVMISIALYVYATSLKRMPFVGNIVLAALAGLSLLIVGVFDIVPAIYPENASTQSTFLDIIFDYSIFAFILSLLYTTIKNIEDIDGDYKAGHNTLAVAIGRERTKKIAFALSFLPIAAVVYYIINFLSNRLVLMIYALLCLLLPLLYISIKLFLAKTKTDYKHIRFVLKLVMILAIISLILFAFILY